MNISEKFPGKRGWSDTKSVAEEKVFLIQKSIKYMDWNSFLATHSFANCDNTRGGDQKNV